VVAPAAETGLGSGNFNRIDAMSLLRLLPVLAFAASPAWAQDEPLGIDLVATVLAGIGDGATAQIAPEPMIFARTAPGSYEGKTAAGLAATLTVVESTPCLFDVTFTFGDQSFPVRIDAGLITSITFVAGGSMGLAEPMQPWSVQLGGPEGLASRVLADGGTEALDNSPPLATSIPLVELEAAAARLQALCPAR
jgi:hypothetical protein